MTVDLLPNSADLKDGLLGGVVEFRNGIKFYSLVVGPDLDGEFEVRIENGVYYGFTREGRKCHLEGRRWIPYSEESEWDIVKFTRCRHDHPIAKEAGYDGPV